MLSHDYHRARSFRRSASASSVRAAALEAASATSNSRSRLELEKSRSLPELTAGLGGRRPPGLDCLEPLALMMGSFSVSSKIMSLERKKKKKLYLNDEKKIS